MAYMAWAKAAEDSNGPPAGRKKRMLSIENRSPVAAAGIKPGSPP